jgi:hypothetical protein
MKLTKISRVAVGALALMTIVPMLAMAQVSGGQIPPTGIITGYNTGPSGGVVGVIKTVTNWMFGILLLAAVVFLIFAAFLYLTSGGDEEKRKKATHYVTYAVIAVAIGVLAYSIVALVGSLFGYTVPTQ